jgi:hypothetical protein
MAATLLVSDYSDDGTDGDRLQTGRAKPFGYGAGLWRRKP